MAYERYPPCMEGVSGEVCAVYNYMNNADIWQVSSYWLPGYGNCSSIDFVSTLKDTCA